MTEAHEVGESNDADRNMDWLLEPVRRAIEDIRCLHGILGLSREGIDHLSALLDRYRSVPGPAAPAPPSVELLEQATDLTTLADREIKSGFSVLHSWAVVALWTQLEVFMDDFAEAWLTHSSEFQGNKKLQKMKIEVQLSNYIWASPEERIELAWKEIKKKDHNTPHMGAGRFESWLRHLGLERKMHNVLRRAIDELAQVRNAIVHQASFADAQLLETCRWLSRRGVQKGCALRISTGEFEMYLVAVMAYLTYVSSCVSHKLGQDTSSTDATVQMYVERLEACLLEVGESQLGPGPAAGPAGTQAD